MVAVDEADDAEDPSHESSGSVDSGMGSSDGRFANFDLTKDFWRSLISNGFGSNREVLSDKMECNQEIVELEYAMTPVSSDGYLPFSTG